MRHFKSVARTLGLIGFACTFSLPGRAQDGTGKAATPPRPTLAAALATATLPTEGIVLTVDADKVTLPDDTVLPGVTLSVTETAALYGRIARIYEGVTAVAPSTMTVVYSPPDTPNPYDGMPPKQVLKLLAASFTPDQWKAFMGAAGIGYTDLTAGPQRQLFEALFPDGHLKVIRDNPTGPNDPNTRQDISGDALTQARLKLGYLVSIALPVPGKPDEHIFAGSYEPKDAPARYFMENAQSDNVDHEFGATVSETVPNAPKPGDLRFGGAALKADVPLDDVKTVDDLMAHIANATHMEIYADARYGKRSVTLLGSAKTARAADLLPALALCVCGTFRQVGPAYVLTDDLTGLGTKHVLWKTFEDKAQAMLPGGNSSDYQPIATAPYTMKDIGWDANPIAFSADQQKAYWAKNSAVGGSSGILDLTLPFDQLTPAQQEAARGTLEADQKEKVEAGLDGTIMVQAEPELEITLPSLDGPVIVFQSYQSLLPNPPVSPMLADSDQNRIAAKDAELRAAQRPVTTANLKAVVQRFGRRAARLAPQSTDDVTRALAAMAKLGFNEMWVQITPGPDSTSDVATTALVAQAVQEGRKSGIVVCPEISLLGWGKTTPVALLDRDILGQTVTEAAKTTPNPIFGAHDTVSPFAPEVVTRLTALVRALGGVKGIGGMVWDDLVPVGYKAFKPDSGEDSWGDPLGFAPAGRLACLRRTHVDPIDLYTNSYTDERAHVSVPGFSDDFSRERSLYDGWRGLRANTVQNLARWLARTLPTSFAPGASPRLPLIVPPANEPMTSLYGSWDDLRQPPPDEAFDIPKGPDGQPQMGVPVTERMPGALQYTMVTVYGPPEMKAKTWAENASSSLRSATPGAARNIVLDATASLEGLSILAE